MNYRKMLEQRPQYKAAVVEDGNEITYGGLLKLAEDKEKQIYGRSEQGYRKDFLQETAARSLKSDRQLYFIEEETVIGELAAFLACQGGCRVPVISDGMTEEEKHELRRIQVPQDAVMGALTSGTTGKRKILFRTYESWADYFPCQNGIFSMGADTVLFAQGSLAFTGNLNIVMALLYTGGRLVATRRFHPQYWLSVIKEYHVDYIYLIPAKMTALCKAVKKPYAGVKHFVTGSQSFGKMETAKAKECFPEMKVILYYGSSEVSYITYLMEEDMTGGSGQVGRPFPEVEVTIQNGVFYVDNNCGIIGIEHPFCTKDLGREDENGCFYFEGRQDDLLNVNGRKCSAYRIEQAVKEQMGMAAAVAVQRKKDRDELVAYYEEMVEEPAAIQIRRQLRERLSAWEIPKQFIQVEELPRTASGKIRRKGMTEVKG